MLPSFSTFLNQSSYLAKHEESLIGQLLLCSPPLSSAAQGLAALTFCLQNPTFDRNLIFKK